MPDSSHPSVTTERVSEMSTSPNISEEISLRDFATLLTKRKWLLPSIAAFSIAVGASLSWLIPPTYRATVLVAPVSRTATSGQFGRATSMIGRLSGLASLTGLANTTMKTAESIAILKSKALTRQYLTKNDLLPLIYANQWNAAKQKWNTRKAADIPTLWRATQYFDRKIFSVTTDTKTGLITVTIRWKNPYLAATWANGLVSMANRYLRTRSLAKTTRNIAYLNEQADKTDVVQLKRAIYELIQAQISKAMLAKGTKEYAFKVLDPAIAPQKPSSPKPLLWIFLAFAAGQIITLLTCYIYLTWTRFCASEHSRTNA